MMGGTTITLAALVVLGLHVRRPRRSRSDEGSSMAETIIIIIKRAILGLQLQNTQYRHSNAIL